jgi:hypothetical protein
MHFAHLLDEFARARHIRVMQNANRALLASLLLAALAGPASGLEGVATTTSTNVSNSLYDEAASEGAYDLIQRVDEALNALRYTIHDISTDQYWSDSGRYEVDCSGYVNRMVEDAVPTAFDQLMDARNTDRPRSSDYYYFFKSIDIGGTRGRWRRPAAVRDLRPGDLLVWRYTEEQDTGSTGHTTIVVGVPVKDTSRGSNIYRVRVTDSARSGHTRDNRGSKGSGVGAGEILVKVNSSNQPLTYAWSLTGPFHSGIAMAMGRPRY